MTEQGVFNWPDPEIHGWRNYRIEYGGCNEDCYWEGVVFLPPAVDSTMMMHIFEIMQVPEALEKLKAAVEKIHKEGVGEKSNWMDTE